jgi:hypothetical protein
MSDYKFWPGQLVNFIQSRYVGISRGPYEIMQRLPQRDGEFQYRVRSHQEDYERVAKKSERGRRDS